MTASPTNFDYSRFDVYRKCPQQFKWKYVDNRVPKTPPNMYYALPGIVIQKLFELFYNDQWFLKRGACREFMYNKAPEIYESTLKWCHVDWKSKIATKTKQSVFEEFLEMIGKNLDLIKERKLLGNFAKSEYKLKTFFDNNRNVILTSKVDFIIQNQDGVMILDGKATSNKKGYLDDPSQLYFYAMMYKYKWLKYPDKIGFWFWRDASIEYVPFDNSIIENLKESMKDVLYKIYKKKFAATPEYKACLFCPFKDECFENKKHVAEKIAEKTATVTEEDLKAFL